MELIIKDMEEQLINFETAKLAREKGFDVDNRENHYFYCFPNGKLDKFKYLSVGYGDDVLAPTQSLLQKWLREVHNLHVVVKRISYSGYTSLIVDLNIYKQNGFIKEEYINSIGFRGFEVYEDALEKGLQEALKLIKSGKSSCNGSCS